MFETGKIKKLLVAFDDFIEACTAIIKESQDSTSTPTPTPTYAHTYAHTEMKEAEKLHSSDEQIQRNIAINCFNSMFNLNLRPASNKTRETRFEGRSAVAICLVNTQSKWSTITRNQYNFLNTNRISYVIIYQLNEKAAFIIPLYIIKKHWHEMSITEGKHNDPHHMRFIKENNEYNFGNGNFIENISAYRHRIR
jgi:hypothetical protein